MVSLKIGNKITALILGAALIFTAVMSAGCGANTRHAMTVNGEEVAAGIYIINQYYAAGEAQSKFAEEYPDIDMWEEGFKHDDYQLDGVKYSDWVNQRAIELTARVFAVEAMFESRGLEFTPEELSDFNLNADSKWNDDIYMEQLQELYEMYGEQAFQFGLGGQTWGEFFEEAGASRESFKFVELNADKAAAIFASIYGADGTEPVPEEEWLPIFESDYIRFRMVAIATVGEDGEELPADELESIKEFAQEQLEIIKEGGSFYEARQAYYELISDNPDDGIYDFDFDDLYSDMEDDIDEIEDIEDTLDLDEDESDEDENEGDEDSDEDLDDEESEDDDALEDEELVDDENADETDLEEEGTEFNVFEELDKELEEYININEFPDNEVVEHILTMDFNSPEIFQTETGDYIIMRLDVLEREDVFEEYRDLITINLKSDEFDDMLEESARVLLDTAIVINQSAIDRYKPRIFIER
ncbi:MAG: hypothetical protein FWH07_03390 [Oscillospiraceae bacterium]|nr:hypothetical protein [Oscillospiraceae bacterium]